MLIPDRYLKYLSLLVSVAMLFGAWQLGWIQHVWEADRSYISSVIAALFGLAWLDVMRDNWEGVHFWTEQMPNLGLVGTVVGFILAFTALDPAAAATAEGAKQTITTLVEGMGVALYTTLVGSVGFMWMAMVEYFHGR